MSLTLLYPRVGLSDRRNIYSHVFRITTKRETRVAQYLPVSRPAIFQCGARVDTEHMLLLSRDYSVHKTDAGVRVSISGG